MTAFIELKVRQYRTFTYIRTITRIRTSICIFIYISIYIHIYMYLYTFNIVVYTKIYRLMSAMRAVSYASL